jgi:hypothetical protein
MDSIPWVHHSREEGSLDYDRGFVRLQIHMNFDTIIYRQQSALAATASPLFWPQATSIASTHPCVQLQAVASSILAPLAILQQQCRAHLALQSIIALQQQQ